VDLTLSGDGRRIVEGTPGQPFMRSVEDVATILEACIGHQVDRVLLYAENLTEQFFDLSSGEAGLSLQKFRNCGIRVAVVCSPDVRFSRRFGEMIAEESRGPYFRLFDERGSAHGWLCDG
jgi:hypothetical protein